MVAASSERTWTASRTEPGWTRAERGGTAGHGLQRGGEADDRPLPLGEAGALRRLQRADQRDPPLGRGQIGLGRLDPGGERLGRGAGAVGLAGGAARLDVELPVAAGRRRPPRAAPAASASTSPPRGALARRAEEQRQGREEEKRASFPYPSR